MHDRFVIYKRVLPSVGPIIVRTVFLLANIIIFCVIILLFVFGSTQAALFLGIVFILNILIAVIQDIRTRITLEKLQMLTALSVVRINADKTEVLILAEEIKKGDLLKLKLGDQVPCEGIFVTADNIEISEALITGESNTFSKKTGDAVIGGAIITSGHGIIEAKGLFRESRLFMVAEGVKTYAAHSSSIQQAINTVMKYGGFTLLATIAFIISRGVFLHESKLAIVTSIGALGSTIMPQGLMVVITLLFSIGAASYAKRNVLFQEINATEKLGRIKNLCMDKTGTLTDNILVVEHLYTPEGISTANAGALTDVYISGSEDSSQTIVAVKKYLKENLLEYNSTLQNIPKIKVTAALPFSSWRQYGAVEVLTDTQAQSVFVGTPDIFLPRIATPKEKKWLEKILEENTHLGKRVLCVAYTRDGKSATDIDMVQLSMLAVFVFTNTLRPGIGDAITFFQSRGVRVRILSGDTPTTVQAVAASVGVTGADSVVTGEEIEKWDSLTFDAQAHKYTVFAQILPEHKVKLIESFKKDGFTAMVGDGVNDALAMKKADLGIAMFDGVPVTRQLAGVILMTNSFADLPGAVELADHFIRSIEISAGVYINQSLLGLLLFIGVSIFGYSYPLTALNITFINYFAIGFSGILITYWALRPSRKIAPASDKPFLSRVLPLVVVCAIFEAIGIALVFISSLPYLTTTDSRTLVGFAFILFGFLFLFFAIKVYSGFLTNRDKVQLAFLGIVECVTLYLVLHIPVLLNFFNIGTPFPSGNFFGKTILVIFVFGGIQYLFINSFLLKRN